MSHHVPSAEDAAMRVLHNWSSLPDAPICDHLLLDDGTDDERIDDTQPAVLFLGSLGCTVCAGKGIEIALDSTDAGARFEIPCGFCGERLGEDSPENCLVEVANLKVLMLVHTVCAAICG